MQRPGQLQDEDDGDLPGGGHGLLPLRRSLRRTQDLRKTEMNFFLPRKTTTTTNKNVFLISLHS